MTPNPTHVHGSPCIRCAATLRYRSSGGCVACTNRGSAARAKADPARHLTMGRAWDKANRERRRAIGARYQATHPERQGEWARANPDKAAAKSTRWRIANPDKAREAHVKWCATHPGKASASTRAWQQAHPDEAKALTARRRARKAGAEVGCRKEYAAFVRWARTEPTIPCHYCGKGTTPKGRHLDHYIPLARGGADAVSNLRVACAPCNHRKHAKMPVEFMECAV